MTLKELSDLLTKHCDYRDGTEVVQVLLAEPSIGPRSADKVKSVGPGMDWDSGRFFIYTESSLVKKTDNQSAFDAARDLLMYLATKPSRRQSYETRTAQSILTRTCKYTAEDFIKYRHLFHKAPGNDGDG